MSVKVTVIGADAVAARFRYMSPKMQAAMAKNIKRLAFILQRYIKESKLSGQVLNARTGTLRRSIAVTVDEQPGHIIGHVGTVVKYGAVHELGFSGQVSVKEHLRRTKAQKKRALKGKQQGPAEQGSISVRAHSRTVNFPERSFLRTALEDKQSMLNQELRNAVTRVLAGGDL